MVYVAMGRDAKRYVRLKELSGFVKVKWDVLFKKHVVIAGVGGLGSIASEMLTRCGIGTLSLIDMDVVNEENLNRLFYRTEHIGQRKVDVAKITLAQVNPDVHVETYHTDICAEAFEPVLEKLLKRCDLLLMGLDNLPSRQYVNVKCVITKTPYVDAGVSRSSLSGNVFFIKPQETACAECIGFGPPIRHKRGLPCNASLPTTFAIIAGIQVQQALKYLLGFGATNRYLAYDAFSDEITLVRFDKNPDCHICSETRRRRAKAPKASAEELEALARELED